METEVRPLTLPEARLLADALRDTPHVLGYLPAELTAFRIVRVARAPGGALAGACLCRDLAGGWSEISLCCVLPEHRGRGIGRALLDQSLADLRARGRKVYVLSRTPEVVRWMERAGFTLTRNPFAAPWPVHLYALRHYASAHRFREARRKAPLRRADRLRFVAGTLRPEP